MKKTTKTKCELDWFIAKEYIDSLHRLGGLTRDEKFIEMLEKIEKYVNAAAFTPKDGNGDIKDFYVIVEYEK
ncbi:MAG: hypothetical protein FWE22_05275 [Firmicutes bacterium]|nr:hypothetical protein [Bacillota bacterium]